MVAHRSLRGTLTVIGLSVCLTSCSDDGNSTRPTTAPSIASTKAPNASAPASSEAADAEATDQPTTDAAAEATQSTRVSNNASESAIVIAFEDIQLPIQADMVFRPFMLTDRARELDGKKIRIDGYMLPDTKTKGIKQFVLLKNTECKFGPGGQADHLLNVEMVDGATADFRDVPITVVGVLTIKPFSGPDGNTWSIYDLSCERVERFRPRR